jgi:PAS domain-containing protein
MTLDGIGIAPFAVLEAASESILVTDADMESPGLIIVYANPAFERITGWSVREVVGKASPPPPDERRPMHCTPQLTSSTRWSIGMRSELELAVVQLMLESVPISVWLFSAISGRVIP